jgi:signal transduction histidine kinase
MSQRGLLAAWLLLASVCSGLMVAYPGRETLPYHIGWFGFAVAYGFGPWSRRTTLLTVAAYTACSGAVLVWRVDAGVIDGEELYEIPLMCMLVSMMVWHVRRRHAAALALGEMMQRERRRALIRERLSRLTSHEMRSPLTIAVGYVDHLLGEEQDAERREDLLVVRDELGRLTRGSDRLLRLMQLQDQTDVREVDLDRLLRDTAERWAAVADREWAVDCEVATFRCSPERIRACLDTLIENSLRYTEAGDAVRVVASQLGEDVVLGVADSGPGLDPHVSAALNRGDGTDSLLRDPRSQTGLGLSLVREVAGAHGGRLLTGRAAEGGALVMVLLPPATAGEGPAHTSSIETPAGPPYTEPVAERLFG